MTSRPWKAFPLTIAFAFLALIQPANAQTTCNDGTSSAASGRGACSGHGGVAKATATSRKADRAAQGGRITYSPRGGAAVTCGDGTTSAGGRGACSHHGGIAAATAATPAAPAPSAPANTRTLPPMAAPRTAPAPSRMGQAPSGASAQCRDGTYSYSRNRRGTCSHHGGVATWM